MHITVMRQPSAKGCTLSKWFIEGQPVCVGLEDVVRPNGQFVYGQTAIPKGTYRVVIDRSQRFSALAGQDVLLPHLLDIPGQVKLFGGRPVGECGIRIHSGNYATQSDGCLLPGVAVGTDGASVVASRAAFKRLYDRIAGALAENEPVTITIS